MRLFVPFSIVNSGDNTIAIIFSSSNERLAWTFTKSLK